MRRALKLLGDALLTLAALGGAACIVLVVLAFTGGYSLIMFKTGSMHPTIPAGSVALVQEIAASEVEVGDILTVDRDNTLPVTHRVTSTAPGPTPDSRTITMKGDANEVEDPHPYLITDARITIGSVPHLAHVIVWMGNAWVMAGITVGAAGLVTWAFWPRDRDDDDDEEGGSHAHHTHHARHAAVLTTAVVAVALQWVPGEPAQAETGVVKLTSNLDAGQVYELHASEALNWDIDIDALAAPSEGDLNVAILGRDGQDLRIHAEVGVCSVQWSDAGCSGSERRVDTFPVNDAEWQSMVNTDVPGIVHLRIGLTAQSPVTVGSDSVSTVTVRASAAETVEEVRLDTGPELAQTGRSHSWIALALAPAAILAGLALTLLGRRATASSRRQRSGGTDD